MARKFEFVHNAEERATTVSYRGEVIGAIHGNEDSGRYCFVLDCDASRKPQLYRGRPQAAEALLAVYKTIKDWEQQGSTLRELVVQAWRSRPATAGETNIPKARRPNKAKPRAAKKSRRPQRARA
jgi:hypothetical protein